MAQKNSRTLLAIVGPTASGKSHLGILVARRLNGEIISADSRQVYKYLSIGTAKPSEEERCGIPHHFMDICEPTQEYSAGQFGIEARQTIDELFARNSQPILVGGSGLYIKAIIDGLFESEERSEEIRRQLEEEYRQHGVQWLYEKLQQVDPKTANTIDRNNIRRLIRALEIYYVTGKPKSLHVEVQQSAPPFSTLQIGLEWNRVELYNRIEQRVDEMLTKGLVDEVKMLQEKGCSPKLNALNTVGYKEAFEFLDGKISYDTMVALIKRNTRRFAKRQLTWFRADKRIRWFPVQKDTDWDQLADEICQFFLEQSNSINC
ncbi:MAG: tRNA (adenosine(37)-N6)-dimethylallyltransferase MiaA [Bacteroidetes bacterium]|nr:tRNA (adenosine(37)-N6)-dimethylallyltransferase MiaA [Bacteroidota bacterium]